MIHSTNTSHRDGRLLRGTLFALLLAIMPVKAQAGDFAEQQLLVEKAKLTLEAFAADPNLKETLHELGPQARALFIIPQFMRGAFIFGGAGGSGILLVRDEKTGK